MNAMRQQQQHSWVQSLHCGATRVAQLPPPVVEGRLTRMVGLTLEASGCRPRWVIAAKS